LATSFTENFFVFVYTISFKIHENCIEWEINLTLLVLIGSYLEIKVLCFSDFWALFD
jgi:hypothetical protein